MVWKIAAAHLRDPWALRVPWVYLPVSAALFGLVGALGQRFCGRRCRAITH